MQGETLPLMEISFGKISSNVKYTLPPSNSLQTVPSSLRILLPVKLLADDSA